MTSLTAMLGSPDETPEDKEAESDRLLNLYRNRAELKKEFAELRNEKFRLQDRLQEQEGAVSRVAQKLQHLENLLLDPEWVYNIVTFFQLRRLNISCQTKLENFAEQLKRQREQRLQSHVMDEWNALRVEEAAVVERQVGEQRMQVQMLEDRLHAERHRLATMGVFAKLFRGRTIRAQLDELAKNVDAAQEEERLLMGQLDEIEYREPPDMQGLDIPTKRLINLMIIAFGQHLYLHFAEAGLAEMAKESAEKSVGAVNYGGKTACDEILERAKEKFDSLESADGLVDVLQRRAKLLGEKAKFRSDDDAVPTAASVSTVYAFDRNGVAKESAQDLLGENYWNLINVVSR